MMSKFPALRGCVKIDIENLKRLPPQANVGMTMIRLLTLLELLDEDFKEESEEVALKI